MTEPVGQSPEDVRERLLIRDKEYPRGIIRRLTDDEWAALDAATVRPPGDEAGLRAALTKALASVPPCAAQEQPVGTNDIYVCAVHGELLFDGRCEDWDRGVRDAVLAALAAEPDREEPGLDVERLAEALQASAVVRRFVTGSGAVHRDIAVDVAAEYGRLATAPREEPADG